MFLCFLFIPFIFFVDVGAVQSAKCQSVVIKVDRRADAGSTQLQSVQMQSGNGTLSEWIDVGQMRKGKDYRVVFDALLDTEESIAMITVKSSAANNDADDQLHMRWINNCVSTAASFDRSHDCYNATRKTIVVPCRTVLESSSGLSTLAINSASAAAGVYNNTLFVVGNGAEKYAADYNLTSSTAWASNPLVYSQIGFAVTPSQFSYGHPNQAMVVGNKLYAFHAATGNLATDDNTLIIYNLDEHRFENVATYDEWSTYTAHWGCVAHNPLTDDIYNMGNTDDMEKYNIVTDTWTVLASLVSATSSAGCAMDLDSTAVYLLGGWIDDGTLHSNRIAMYSVANNAWSVLGVTLIQTIKSISCVLSSRSTGGLIYCAGGYLPNNENSDQIEIFDPSANTVTMDTHTLVHARRQFSAFALENESRGCILLFGGYLDSGVTDYRLEYRCEWNSRSARTHIDLSNCSFASSL